MQRILAGPTLASIGDDWLRCEFAAVIPKEGGE